jgi:hypothetical protein
MTADVDDQDALKDDPDFLKYLATSVMTDAVLLVLASPFAAVMPALEAWVLLKLWQWYIPPEIAALDLPWPSGLC